MPEHRWDAARAAFDRVIELDPAERETEMQRLSVVDPELAGLVGGLLDGHARADTRFAPLDSSTDLFDSTDEPATQATDPLGLVGTQLAQYEVLELLGAGGMGVVYRAEDVSLRRAVALKFLSPRLAADSRARDRFLHEARAVAALDHPNICAIHEVGESDGRPYLVMSHYEGETLRERLNRDGALPVDVTLDIATQAARGLARAHAAGVVHRDLTPANLLLGRDNVVRILDFGLARVGDEGLSTGSAMMGTLPYMSPEQLRGEAQGVCSDLWSLGVVMVEMLTGRRPIPFAGLESDGATLPASVPDALRRVLARLLRTQPSERYESADALLADLGGINTAKRHARSGTGGRWGVSVRLLLAATLFTLVVVSVVLRSRLTSREGNRATDVRPRSVAVLPLRNYSGDPARDFFADGMTDEITTALAKVRALHVIAHQSVLEFTGSRRPIPEIARRLGVRYVVDGSVTEAGDRVRFTVSLVDASHNATVWTERFERERRDVISLQHEVALAVTRGIEGAVSERDIVALAPGPAVNPDAYLAYLRGTRARYAATATNDFREAERQFSEAIRRDSNFALAYAGLSIVRAMSGDPIRATPLANRALSLDSTLADAHLALGMARQLGAWDWVGAEAAFRQAIRLHPSHAEAHHELSMLLLRRRRPDESLREAQITLEYAPLSARFENAAGQVLLFSKRYPEAVDAAARAIAIDSSYLGPYYLRGHAYMQQGRYDEALRAWLDCNARGGDATTEIGYLYAMTGKRELALRELATLKARWPGAKAGSADAIATGIAQILVGLGDRSGALEWLERGVTSGTFIVYLGIDPYFQPLHDEPRFQAILHRVGLDD